MNGRFLFVAIVCLVGCSESSKPEEPVIIENERDDRYVLDNQRLVPTEGLIRATDDVTPVSEPSELTAGTSGSDNDLFTIRTICTAHGLEDISACEHSTGCTVLFNIYAHLDTKIVLEADRKKVWSSFREPMSPERLELAKSVVRRWDAEYCDTAIPREFLTDAVDLVDQPELLRTMLSPEWYHDGPDFLNQIDGRAGLYISAHYGANRVKNTVIQTLKTNGLYRETLAFVRRHGTEKQIVDMEASLLKLMKRNHCYSFIEDTKGHFTRWYTFTDDCGVSK